MEDEIERASDDDKDSSDEDSNGELKTHSNARRRRGKIIDEDVHESEVDNSDEDEDPALMDDLEDEEVYSVDAGSKRKTKEAYKQKLKKGRNKAEDADLGDDEE